MRPSWSPDQGLAPYSCPRWLSSVASRGALSYVIFVPLPSSLSRHRRCRCRCRRRRCSFAHLLQLLLQLYREVIGRVVVVPTLLPEMRASRLLANLIFFSPVCCPAAAARSATALPRSSIHPSIHPSHHSCQQQDLSTHSPSTGKSSNSSSSSSCAALFWVGRGFSVELEVAALADAAAGAAFAALSGAPGMMSCRDVKWVGGF